LTQGTKILAGLQSGVPFEAGIDIEPAIHGALAIRNRNIREISKEDCIAEA